VSEAPAIEAEDVRLTFDNRSGPVEILRGISLTIPQGQSVSIVGPSGSGKTSLLMVMAGLERATAGTLRLADQDFSALDEDALAELRGRFVGIVFQSFHLIPTMTALENVALPLELTGRSDALDDARQRLIDVGLGHRLGHYPAQLSGGEQQRVALARALAPRPSVIFADEPTGNLDQSTGAQVIDLLFSLQRSHGATLVLVTHDAQLAAQCERMIHMADGRIVSDSPVHQPADAADARSSRATDEAAA